MPTPTFPDDPNGLAADPPPVQQGKLGTASDALVWYQVCAVLCTTVPGLFVLLRLYTKVFIVRKTDLTDYFMVLAFLAFIPMIAIGRVMFGAGAGMHQWNIRNDDLYNILYWLHVYEIMYGPVILLIKLAILLQYLHLLAPNRTVNRFVFFGALIIMVVIAVFYITITLLSIFRCSPHEASWNRFIENAKCINLGELFIAAALFNILSDIAILLLPTRSIWVLRIPIRRKISISALFAIGSLACIADIGVIVFLVRINQKNADISYITAWLSLCIFAEISFGIIVTCMLSLAKLVEAKGCALRRCFATRSGSTKPKDSGHDRGWSSVSEEAQVPLPTLSHNTSSKSPPWNDMTFETGTHYLDGHQS
ncbi:hypothetical protein HBH70_147360 [Parastagonospora nodorum]|nr:hypothetical protein HBH49_174270 [Parastagonospora nodorum]KAH4076050.1 hypothetical protein HBH50_024970 [Parastagonospora nodorum]KAH4097646.1 hypothetical protein HBH48_022330 [Parastagonospora nodorum]KAH4208887.1 hypothetical protein HBI95_082750 [Parastagonospora nodorum]KAH5073573.1 hypothetical protein HBH95_153390 [Parastagonospora nodorum]